MRKSIILLGLSVQLAIHCWAQEVIIEDQIWNSKNLAVSTFRNGDIIPQARSKAEMHAYSKAKEAAWCYYNLKDSNGVKYGKMYNGYAITDPRGIAPVGYVIPLLYDYRVLLENLGGNEVARYRLKSKTGWYKEGNGTNSSGFNALPGGQTGDGDTVFGDLGKEVNFWTQTLYTEEPNNPQLIIINISNYYSEEEHGKGGFFLSGLGSYQYVRCLKEQENNQAISPSPQKTKSEQIGTNHHEIGSNYSQNAVPVKTQASNDNVSNLKLQKGDNLNNPQQLQKMDNYHDCPTGPFKMYCVNITYIGKLQRFLNEYNRANLEIDGRFTPETVIELRKIQGYEKFDEKSELSVLELLSICEKRRQTYFPTPEGD